MQIQTPDDISQLGSILCVFAHPDDETFSMGGILAAATANGQEVYVITATRGEGGAQDEQRWPAHQLAQIRSEEMADALAILGVKQHEFMDYRDGGCNLVPADQAVDRLCKIIDDFRPDSIFSFGADGLTGHDDHKTVASWAALAKQRSGSHAKLYCAVLTDDQYEGFREVDDEFNFFFNTNKPPTCHRDEAAICFELDDRHYKTKMDALRAMPSQYESVIGKFDDQNLRAGFGVEAFLEV